MPRTTRLQRIRQAAAAVAAVVTAACARHPAPEPGLNKDVVLAAQLQRQQVPAVTVTPALIPVAAAPMPTASISATPAVHRARVNGVRPREATAMPAAGGGRHVVHADGGEVLAARPEARVAYPAAAVVAAPRAPETTTSNAGASDAGTYAPAPSGPGTYATQGGGPEATSAGVSSGGGYGAAAPVYREPQAHAARDGVFGSVAGAILGAAASGRGNRVRGGLIGAVAGGALGALYGGSVDRTESGYGAGYRGARAYRTY
ncbi:MAG TPA: hypothetical protein VGD56_11920 [Gemmatirosa sp.]